MPKLTPFDAAEYLDNPQTIGVYLAEAFATRDTELIVEAINDVARAMKIKMVVQVEKRKND